MDTKTLENLIEAELAAFEDPEIVSFIRGLLVTPRAVPRDWDYGEAGQKYICWNVLEDPNVGTAIAYCEGGFGPRCPWGLVELDDNKGSLGMDSGWFGTFLRAFFDSFSATRLDIYYVSFLNTDQKWVPYSPDPAPISWKAAWAEVERLRAAGSPEYFSVDTARYKDF